MIQHTGRSNGQASAGANNTVTGFGSNWQVGRLNSAAINNKAVLVVVNEIERPGAGQRSCFQARSRCRSSSTATGNLNSPLLSLQWADQRQQSAGS